ncbi:MAG: hypothetical protein ACD_54C00108G0002 [uncultured bacterium]|nr:MAG: hypothetical protein ACD_54C00108G0002 [uncultured bacterium]
MTTPNTFDLAIAADARLQARFDAVAEKLTADLAAQGLALPDRNALKQLPAVKMFCFTDAALPADALDEALRLPELADQLRKREVARALANGDSALHAELDRMGPTRRLTYGRDLAAAQAAEKAAMPAPARPTAEEEAKLLLMLRRLPPAERISAARAAGMI